MEPWLTMTTNNTYAMDIYNGYLYVITGGYVRKINVNDLSYVDITTEIFPCGLAIDNGYVYSVDFDFNYYRSDLNFNNLVLINSDCLPFEYVPYLLYNQNNIYTCAISYGYKGYFVIAIVSSSSKSYIPVIQSYSVYSVAIKDEYIYASTTDCILRSKLSDLNTVNNDNWYPWISLPGNNYGITLFNNFMYVVNNNTILQISLINFETIVIATLNTELMNATLFIENEFIYTLQTQKPYTNAEIFKVTQPFIKPTFVAVECYVYDTVILPKTSTNGITGKWSPISTQNTGTIKSTFTPDPGQHASKVTMDIIVNADICFPAGTLIETDQEIIAIERIDPNVHTIRTKPILYITKTVSDDDYLVGFKKHALGNVPYENTIMSKEHKVLYRGEMHKADMFLAFKNVVAVKYTGEFLYNVLLYEHSTMNVNGLICETLHPNNAIAQLYKVPELINHPELIGLTEIKVSCRES